ncbi:citrate/2-methylcitrate synthase [Natrialba sp. INN-245]|uniref:citrate/2-methylcitrate synthase n=1 Tax=Natrialba sp. INN-245 TaxID=2690967 RepID=UPI001310E4E6|nr:citrate (Si)-synthase [Natrialba sp. INN-245]
MAPSVFDPELESITVAETELCDVDGEAGELIVRGYPIEELAANAGYEESLFLLLEGRLPTPDELEEFRAALSARRAIPAVVDDLLCEAARADGSPMDAVRMGVAAAALEAAEATPNESGIPETDAPIATEPVRRTVCRLVAVVPTVVAAYWRYRQGEEPLEPRSDLNHAANYLYLLTGEEPTPAEVRGLETFFVTALEHGLNPSTFTARTVVSTDSDLVSAITAAVGSFKGTRHGGTLDSVFATLREVHDTGNGERYVRERLEAGERLEGFGHRIYRVRDPRAAVLAAAAERFYERAREDDLLESIREFETVAETVLSERMPTRDVRATVEFYAAALLHGVGVPPALFTATFAASRVGGWCAHCLEQRANNGLVRPTARYVGATERSWIPLDERFVAGDDLVRTPARSSLEPVSETLSVLSEPNRLQILLALAERDEPIAYSTLRASVSAEDKGQFNYHLRQLREYFVANREEGYELTDAGRTVVDAVLTEDRLLEDVLE